MKDELDRAIAERGEIGVQVAAYLGDELVIDTWGGIADPDTGREVDSDTLFNIFSVSKAVVSTTVHLQAEKGLLDYDTPIAEYWPEWGCHGKEKATVRDALCHRTGAPQMPDGITAEAMCDWDFMVAALAGLKPLFPAGETPAYQALNFGWILGEVVRRTDPAHRPYCTYIREELFQPLGIGDFWIGIEDAAESRVARLVDSGASISAPPDSLLAKAAPAGVGLTPAVYERPDVRRACIAATGGIANARSAARFWALLANRGELDNVRLLSPERVDAACEPRPGQDPDPVMFGAVMPLSRGGYWRHDDALPDVCPARGPRTICVPGAGGSLGWADPDTGLAVAFCHNHMRMPQKCRDHPAFEIANVIRESLGISR